MPRDTTRHKFAAKCFDLFGISMILIATYVELTSLSTMRNLAQSAAQFQLVEGQKVLFKLVSTTDEAILKKIVDSNKWRFHSSGKHQQSIKQEEKKQSQSYAAYVLLGSLLIMLGKVIDLRVIDLERPPINKKLNHSRYRHLTQTKQTRINKLKHLSSG